VKLCAVLLLALTLAACAPVVYLTPPPVGPAELQRLSDSATNTAVSELRLARAATAADQSARATSTAARAATLESIADSQTLATLAAAKTQDAVSATAAVATAQAIATASAGGTQIAGRAQAAATSSAATSTAQLAAALATEAVHREQQRTMVETASAGMTALLKFLAAVALAFGLWWLAGAASADLTRRRNNAALRDTPIGPVIMITDGRGVIAARLLTAPEPARAPEPVVEPGPQPELIQRTVNGKPAEPIVAEWRLPDLDAERAAIADLVRAAIAVEGEAGTRIPRYHKLEGWRSNPDGWKHLTDVLMKAGHITKASGRAGGTFLTRDRTLYELLRGLMDNTLSLQSVDIVGAVYKN
jgi:hypothetical protein